MRVSAPAMQVQATAAAMHDTKIALPVPQTGVQQVQVSMPAIASRVPQVLKVQHQADLHHSTHMQR